MNKVILTDEQERLRKVIEENLIIAKDWNKFNDLSIIERAFLEMNEAAHTLHIQLSPSPKHHRYMIENRGVQPEDLEFYNHIHPVEDLLKYLDDTSANDDPVDHTLDHEFDFKLYTSRWGHYDNYRLTRNKDGWYVNQLSYKGQSDSYGDNLLISAMEHDSISYPKNVGYFLNGIWERAQDQGLTHGEVQQMLDELAEWISQTEKSAPRHLQI